MAPFRDLVEIVNPGECGPKVTRIGHAAAMSLVAPTFGMEWYVSRGERERERERERETRSSVSESPYPRTQFSS